MKTPMQRRQILDLATPNEDLLFYEVIDYDIAVNRDKGYGTPHHNPTKYPNHELVFITPDDRGGNSYRFYYAANRENQDDYNWQIRDGTTLERIYLVKRELYYGRSAAEAALIDPPVVGEFTYPPVTTADGRFPKYVFVDDEVVKADEKLDSLYVMVKRRYMEPTTSELVWMDEFDRYVRVTKEFIPAEVIPTVPTFTDGNFVEKKQGNTFFDVKITSTVLASDGSAQALPFTKSVVPDYRDFRFPSKLEAVQFHYVWAWADSTDAAFSYAENYFFKWIITNARGGPHQATLTRIVTSDPAAVAALYPLTPIPSSVRETIGVMYAWFHASTKGNNTTAVAKEIEVPSTIHDELTVGENIVTPSSVPGRMRYFTPTLEATPGYTEFMAAIATGEIIIALEPRKLPYNLYEVTVVRINVANLYVITP